MDETTPTLAQKRDASSKHVYGKRYSALRAFQRQSVDQIVSLRDEDGAWDCWPAYHPS